LKIIAGPQELFDVFDTPGIEVINLLSAADKVWITWMYAEWKETIPVLHYTNEVIGSYVTTGVRHKHYSYVGALKEREIYFGTYSVIYIQNCGQPSALTCGDKVGDMTNELGPDEYIEEFVSGGRKNYADIIEIARTMEKKPVCRLRRIMLNYAAAQLDKFDSLRDTILSTDAKDVITVRTKKKIKRKMKQWEGCGKPGTDTVVIVCHLVEKVYRESFPKRIRLDNLDSVASVI
jgi:hypothetical protein